MLLMTFHRMVWVEIDLQSSSCPPPPTGRNNFHETRLLRVVDYLYNENMQQKTKHNLKKNVYCQSLGQFLRGLGLHTDHTPVSMKYLHVPPWISEEMPHGKMSIISNSWI